MKRAGYPIPSIHSAFKRFRSLDGLHYNFHFILKERPDLCTLTLDDNDTWVLSYKRKELLKYYPHINWSSTERNMKHKEWKIVQKNREWKIWHLSALW
jgi:hypothetical protein